MRILSLVALLVLLPGLWGCTQRPPRRQADPVAAGFQRQTFASFDLAMERAIERGEVPGGVLAIARNNAIVYLKAYGTGDPLATPREPLRENTRFDVASLTKPMVTASAAALAACEGEFSLEETLLGFTLDEHLRHRTNLPLYLEWQAIERAREGRSRTPGQAVAAILEHHATHGPPLPPGRGYSNLGYLLAGERIEEVVGDSLEEYLRRAMWAPLGMTQTTYRPAADAPVARTARDIDPGRPFDPLADYVLRTAGSQSPGHSGLFSSARDVSIFAQALMEPGGQRFFGQQCVSAYLLSPPPAVRRDAGDEETIRFSTQSGRTPAFLTDPESPRRRALYHTGYTGCLLWIDPATRTSLVLLTNTTLSSPDGWDPLRRDLVTILRRDLPAQ